MRRIDRNMPWGSWLRIEKVDGGWRYVDDETGATWRSVRAAFCTERLGLPFHDGEPSPALLETVHAVLAMAVRRHVDDRELVSDLFLGSTTFAGFLRLFLAGAGLVKLDEDGRQIAGLTREGRAALVMLIATRPHSARQSPPTHATIADLAELGMGPEGREDRLARLETEAVAWDVAFLRRDQAGRPTVILSMRGSGPMQNMQTVWSLSFRTKDERDRFYEWLCHRLDRWPDWAELATEFGSQKLTHRLLGVMAASLEDEAAQSARSRVVGLIGG